MREIKFRAWFEVNKKMVKSEDLLFEYNGRQGGFIAFSDLSCIDSTFKANLMQYTGLKDKNGLEIYDGDILKCINFKLKAEYICHVGWNARGYWYTYNNEGKSIGFLNNEELPEIIGNIYENPKLIK